MNGTLIKKLCLFLANIHLHFIKITSFTDPFTYNCQKKRFSWCFQIIVILWHV